MQSRVDALNNIADKTFQLCIIGGGATGAACALDAQLRGINTVLLEAGDFAGSTSSASTKIIHGGVRYLEEAIRRADLQEYRVLVRALHERVHMLHNAPHLTRKMEFIVPGYSWTDIAYLDVGLKIYDWLAGSGRIDPSTFLSPEETTKRMPALNPIGLLGSVAYADGQFDDARYNIALVQSFTRTGGSALNHARVIDFERDQRGKIAGVVVKDMPTGQVFHVKGDAVLNATGPLSDSIRQLASPKAARRMRLSKGAHILLPLDLFPTASALLIPKTDDGRVLFAIPWGDRLLVGTTEQEVSPDAELLVTKDDVIYILRHLNRFLSTQIRPEQVVSGYAGARPLVSSSGSEENTKAIARDDVIEIDDVSGLVSVMGGKWTTHRAMAEDAIDRIEHILSVEPVPCQTRDHVLFGGNGFTADFWNVLCRQYGVRLETAHHLANKFGTAAEGILVLSAERPEFKRQIVPDHPSILAEIVYCVRYEMAFTIEDVLARRIGLQFYSWRAAQEAAQIVGSVLAAELGWDVSFTKESVQSYVDKIARLLESAGLIKEKTSTSIPSHWSTEQLSSR